MVLGSIWGFIERFGQQFLRLAGNLVLTRLLAPEFFGLVAIIQSFLTAAELFSDTGLNPALIRHERGDDPKLLNTAWSISIIRGFVLWLVLAAAAYPIAAFMEAPELRYMIPVAAFALVVQGFQSTKIATHQRSLNFRSLVHLRLATQVLSLSVMVVLAWLYHSVWALIIGTLFSSLVFTIGSHVYLKAAYRNHLAWDQESASSLFKFGRWIFLLSILFMISVRADQIFIGKIFSLRDLGLFSVAYGFGTIVTQLVDVLGNVMYPALSEKVRNKADLTKPVLQLQVVVFTMGGFLCSAGYLGGDSLVKLLYDARYAGVGWILPYLMIAIYLNLLTTPYPKLFNAINKPWLSAMPLAASLTTLSIGFYLVSQSAQLEHYLLARIAVDFVCVTTFCIAAWSIGVRTIWMNALFLIIFATSLSSGGYLQGLLVRGPLDGQLFLQVISGAIIQGLFWGAVLLAFALRWNMDFGIRTLLSEKLGSFRK